MAQDTERVWPWSALAGVVAAAAFLATAEALALVASPGGGPLVAVGGVVVDTVPRPLKELAISLFGAYDKVALFAGLGLAVLVAAAAAGILQYRARPAGVAIVGVAGAAAVAAAVTR
ncbi:oxidoreductase, partial [Microbacterium sp. ZXX196]|nr:oxidoreductase [Microbacterium sp. ZXX196]